MLFKLDIDAVRQIRYTNKNVQQIVCDLEQDLLCNENVACLWTYSDKAPIRISDQQYEDNDFPFGISFAYNVVLPLFRCLS